MQEARIKELVLVIQELFGADIAHETNDTIEAYTLLEDLVSGKLKIVDSENFAQLERTSDYYHSISTD